MSPTRRRLHRVLRRLLPFWWWLFWFYGAWLTVLIVGNLWGELAAHWPIAAAMAAGSYVAGSTPMGGGTVGFPVLVLLFDQPASLGRNFSFCVQSIGMASATVFILCSRVPLAWRLLLWTMLGSAVSLPLCSVYVVPHVPDLTVKLVFACLWAAFGLMTLVKIREFIRAHHIPRASAGLEAALGLMVGAVGGLAASLTGVGIDMLLYTALVLIYRADLRIAIATSIVIMAFNSLVGVLVSGALGRLNEAVFYNWLAAAPVVALGAPLGALMMNIIPRHATLVFVSVLCILQLVWTCVNEGVSMGVLGVVILAVLGMNLGFHFLYRWGKRLVPERAASDAGRGRGRRETAVDSAAAGGPAPALMPLPAAAGD